MEEETQMFKAVCRQDAAKLKRIINSLNLPDDLSEWMYGYKLLCTAIETTNDEIIDFLLARNVPVNNANETHRDTPLQLAVKYRDPNIVEKLLKKGADIDKKSQYAKNALDIAILSDNYNNPLRFYKNKTILEVLVDHMSDNNITDQSYVKLLNHLIDKGYLELLEKLLTKCLHVDFNKVLKTYNFLYESVEKKYLNIVSLLLARGVDVNYIDYTRLGAKTALYIACANEDEEMVKLLLTNGARTDIKNGPFAADTSINYFSTFYYPIHAAIKDNDDCKVLELLLDHGADILQKYVDPRGCQGSALSLAFNYSPKKFIEMLIKRGVDINFKDENGNALITFAFNNQDKEAFEYVFTHQDLKALDYHNTERILRTAVQLCQITRVEQIMRYIQQQGPYSSLRYEVDFNLFSSRAHSPILHTLTVCGHNSHLKLLIEYGADVNFLNSRGRTPLHSAFQFRRLESIKNLLKYGADINIFCDDGHTPLDYGLRDHLFRNRQEDNPDSNFLSQVNKVKDIVKFFTQHVVKLKLLNLYVNESINDALITRSTYPGSDMMTRFSNPFKYQKKYEKEIRKMKLEIISDGVTYYDLVTADLVTIIAFLKNDDIFKKFQLESYKTKFPHYWEIISGCFWRGYARKRLLDKVSEHIIFKPIYKLPFPCFRKIMDHFSNADLKEFLVKSAFYFNM